MIFLEYPPCSTCKKARKWLEDNGIPFEARHIRDERPTIEELRSWQKKSGLPLKKLFNTSGSLYKTLALKTKLLTMDEDEQLALLASDGMLVKRPILADGEIVLVGFQPDRWAEALAGRSELCPVCGKHRFAEPYEICPVCGWEHDRVQEQDPDFAGGANRASLNETRTAYQKKQENETK